MIKLIFEIEHWLLKSNFGYFWRPQYTFKKIKQKVTFSWLIATVQWAPKGMSRYTKVIEYG